MLYCQSLDTSGRGFGAVLVAGYWTTEQRLGAGNNTLAVALHRVVMRGNTGGCGAGLAVAGTAGGVSLSLDRSILADNNAEMQGGGLYTRPINGPGAGEWASLQLCNGSRLSSNTAGDSGGGAYVRSYRVQRVLVAGSELVGNQAKAGRGGGMRVHASSLGGVGPVEVAGGSSVRGNTAAFDGGGLSVQAQWNNIGPVRISGASRLQENVAGIDGGGIHVEAASGNITSLSVEDGSTLVGNAAGNHGGGIALRAWAYDSHILAISITDRSQLHNNMARNGSGGAVYAETGGSGSTRVEVRGGSSLTDNSANGTGGGIAFHGLKASVLDLNIAGSRMTGNSAGTSGGALAIAAASVGAVSVEAGSFLSGNRARLHGGALHVSSGGRIQRFTVSGRSVLQDNNATGQGGEASRGGAVSLQLGSDFFRPAAEGDVLRVSVAGSSAMARNRAQEGGALNINMPMDWGDASVELADGASLHGNVANQQGGALYVVAKRIEFHVRGGASVYDNEALTDGGGAYLLTAGHMPELHMTGRSALYNNSAGMYGGALYAFGGTIGSVLLAEGSSITSNTAGASGGGAYLGAYEGIGSVTITGRSHVTRNRAVSGDGGGLFLGPGNRDITAVSFANGSKLSYNQAGASGGGMLAEALSGSVSVSVSGRSRVVGNRAETGSGGGLMLRGFASLVAEEAELEDNVAARRGGAAALGWAPVRLEVVRCRVKNNTALRGSGGAFAVAMEPNELGGLVACPGCGPGLNPERQATFISLLGSTFSENQARYDDGGVLHVSAHEACCASRLDLHVWGCGFVYNTAGGSGGAVAVVIPTGLGGSAVDPVTVRVAMQRSRFTGCIAGSNTPLRNSASNGGAVIVWYLLTGQGANDSPPGIDQVAPSAACRLVGEDLLFKDNVASGGSGGGLLLIACTGALHRATFVNNEANLAGGGVAAVQDSGNPVALSLPVTGGSTEPDRDRGLARRQAVEVQQNQQPSSRASGIRAAEPPQAGDAWFDERNELWQERFNITSAGPDTSVQQLRAAAAASRVRLEDRYKASASPSRRLLEDPESSDTFASAPPDADWALEPPVSSAPFTPPIPDPPLDPSTAGPGCSPSAPSAPWHLTLSACSFTENRALLSMGGGLYADAQAGGLVLLQGTDLGRNEAGAHHGGGAFVVTEGACSAAVLRDCELQQNYAGSSGGGAYLLILKGSTGGLEGSRLLDNEAQMAGAGAVLDVRREAQARATGCDFERNMLYSPAPGTLLGGGAGLKVAGLPGSEVAVRDCTFTGNDAEASNGGGLLVDSFCGAAVGLYNSSFHNNNAFVAGGAAFLQCGGGGRRTRPCVNRPGCEVSNITITGNTAGVSGGGLSLAAHGSASVRGASLHGNTAGLGGGGGIHAANCAALSVRSTIINGSSARGPGGGLRASGCLRLLLQRVELSHNEAGGPGGGVYVAGTSGTGLSSGASTGTQAPSAAVLHRVLLYGNRALQRAGAAQQGGQEQVCAAAALPQAAYEGYGGGVFAAGAASAVLSQCDLARGNKAVFGSALASTQTCDATVPANSTSGAGTDQAQGSGGPARGAVWADLAPWAAAWEALEAAGARGCRPLVLSDTRLPRRAVNGEGSAAGGGPSGGRRRAQQLLPPPLSAPALWMTDGVASVLLPRCTAPWTGPEAPAGSDGPDTDTQDGAATAAAAAAAAHVHSALSGARPGGRLEALLYSLAACWEGQEGRPGSMTAAARTYEPYLGLPPARMQVMSPDAEEEQPGLDGATMSEGDAVGLRLPGLAVLGVQPLRLGVAPGTPFDIAVQLYDSLGQRIILDAEPAVVTLSLRPQPPKAGQPPSGPDMLPDPAAEPAAGSAAASGAPSPLGAPSDGSPRPWFNASVAYLDPGANRSLTVPVVGGRAVWRRLVARGWPGAYTLSLVLQTVSSGGSGSSSGAVLGIIQVPPLELPAQLLPCAAGDALDTAAAEREAAPSWTACAACAAESFALWADGRPALASRALDRADYLQHMANLSARAQQEQGAQCAACPGGAACAGGAVVVPLPGRWHSAHNSTRMHACPNPAACGGGGREGYWRRAGGTNGTNGTAVDLVDAVSNPRTAHLATCQRAWYGDSVASRAARWGAADGGPGSGVGSPPWPAELLASTGLASLPRNGSQQKDPRVPGTCVAWGLPREHPLSYMQQQCAPGYTGNLCAACEAGHYVTPEFDCTPCPSLSRTLGLGLLAFAGNVALVLFAAAASFAEGFGEEAQRAVKQGQRRGSGRVKGQVQGQKAVARREESGRRTSGVSEMEAAGGETETEEDGKGTEKALPGGDETGRSDMEIQDVLKVVVVHLQYLVVISHLNIDYPTPISRLSTVFAALTGAEAWVAFSPSCLRPGNSSAEDARVQLLSGLLLPCAVLGSCVGLWAIRYAYCQHMARLRRRQMLSLPQVPSRRFHRIYSLISGYSATGYGSARSDVSVLPGCGSTGRPGDSSQDGGPQQRGAGPDSPPFLEHSSPSAVPASACVGMPDGWSVNVDANATPTDLDAGAGPDPGGHVAGPAGPVHGSDGEQGLGSEGHESSYRQPGSWHIEHSTGRLPADAVRQQHEAAAAAAQADPSVSVTLCGDPGEGAAVEQEGATEDAAHVALVLDVHAQMLPGSGPQSCSSQHDDPAAVDGPPGDRPEGDTAPHPSQPSNVSVPVAAARLVKAASASPASRRQSSGARPPAASAPVQAPPLPRVLSAPAVSASGHAGCAYEVTAASFQRINAAALDPGASHHPSRSSSLRQPPSNPDPGARRTSPWSRLTPPWARVMPLMTSSGRRSSRSRPQRPSSDGASGSGPSGPPQRLSALSSRLVTRLRSGVADGASALVHQVRGSVHASAAVLGSVDTALGLRQQLGVVVLVALFVLYPSWAQAALSVFACYRIDEGRGMYAEAQQATWRHGYWVRNMNQECYRGTHLTTYLPVGVVSVLLLCLLPPLASFLFIWSARERLHELRVQQVYGFLYRRYRPRFLWWDTVIQLQTLALVAAQVLGRGLAIEHQALLILAFFTLVGVVNSSAAPLRCKLLVKMECMSLGVLSLTITLSLYFTLGAQLERVAADTVAVIVVLLNASVLAFFGAVLARQVWAVLLRGQQAAGEGSGGGDRARSSMELPAQRSSASGTRAAGSGQRPSGRGPPHAPGGSGGAKQKAQRA